MAHFPIIVADGSPFPIENIPFGIFSLLGSEDEEPRGCTIIGDYIVDLSACERYGLFSRDFESRTPIFAQASLNGFAALPREQRINARKTIIAALSSAASPVFTNLGLNSEAFHASKRAKMHLPMSIPEFTDFSCFEEHVERASNMSNMPMPSNFYHSPIAYNGRSSSIIVSGVDLPRPLGMRKDQSGVPRFLPCQNLDYELELGILIGAPLDFGKRLSPDDALDHVFGFVLVNDWSARDIQSYESFPAGPFNSKSFGTSISPWVIVPESLEQARTSPLHQKLGDVPEHLQQTTLEGSIYDINVQAHIARNGETARLVSLTNLKHCYFSIGQILAHRASSGCGLRTGEMVATGTMSSPASERCSQDLAHSASLWELSQNGTREIPIVGGKWLEDGDEVTFDGWAIGHGGKRIGLGEVRTKILPAIPLQ